MFRHEFVILREGGAHTIVGKVGGVRTSLPRHADLDRRTVKAIIKQLNLDWKSFEKEVR
ncbi:MAG: type II toxin-antitoxin system HicA family toxin [Phycisphaerales bacterium]|nr:type II toxin-antitoxin system HicA family toxin [Phycisphaerales bacterium]